MKPALILLSALLLAGCAEYDAYSKGAATYLAGAADRSFTASQWAACNTTTAGALMRRYALSNDVEGWKAWLRFCGWERKAELELPEPSNPPSPP